MIHTEDKARLNPGDRAYNYYDRQPGTIGDDVDPQGWFTFRHDEGSTAILNGERICTLETARRLNYPGA